LGFLPMLAIMGYSLAMSQEIKPCPKSPNCVSSVEAPNDKHYLPAIPYAGSITDAKAELKALIEAMPGSRLIAETDNYLSFEFRSRVFRFVDSLEF